MRQTLDEYDIVRHLANKIADEFGGTRREALERAIEIRRNEITVNNSEVLMVNLQAIGRILEKRV